MNIQEIAERFDITTEEYYRIASSVENEAEFVTVWENTDWWTDENMPQT
jgi:hypothetical protein